jgi:predicted  nucleic acid-binding Zn-ribbon protein
MPHPYTYLDKAEMIKDIKHEIKLTHEKIAAATKELNELTKKLQELQNQR